MAGKTETKQDLYDRIQELEQENEDLHNRLDQVAELVASEEEDDQESEDLENEDDAE